MIHNIKDTNQIYPSRQKRSGRTSDGRASDGRANDGRVNDRKARVGGGSTRRSSVT